MVHTVTHLKLSTAFHQRPEDIDHIAVRNLGIGFYIAEIADNPRERADNGIANISKNQNLQLPGLVDIPPKGDIPIDMCISNDFAYSLSMDVSHVMYRTVKLTVRRVTSVLRNGQRPLGRCRR